MHNRRFLRTVVLLLCLAMLLPLTLCRYGLYRRLRHCIAFGCSHRLRDRAIHSAGHRRPARLGNRHDWWRNRDRNRCAGTGSPPVSTREKWTTKPKRKPRCAKPLTRERAQYGHGEGHNRRGDTV